MNVSTLKKMSFYTLANFYYDLADAEKAFNTKQATTDRQIVQGYLEDEYLKDENLCQEYDAIIRLRQRLDTGKSLQSLLVNNGD